MKKQGLALLLGCLCLTPFAHANSSSFVGINIAELDVDPGNAEPRQVFVRAGARLNEFFGAEARVGIDAGDDKGLEVDNTLGAYVRGILPLSDRFDLYGLVGVTRAKFSVKGGGSETETDISYGVGADFYLTREAFINLEFSRLVDGDDFEADALSLGVGYRF